MCLFLADPCPTRRTESLVTCVFSFILEQIQLRDIYAPLSPRDRQC